MDKKYYCPVINNFVKVDEEKNAPGCKHFEAGFCGVPNPLMRPTSGVCKVFDEMNNPFPEDPIALQRNGWFVIKYKPDSPVVFAGHSNR